MIIEMMFFFAFRGKVLYLLSSASRATEIAQQVHGMIVSSNEHHVLTNTPQAHNVLSIDFVLLSQSFSQCLPKGGWLRFSLGSPVAECSVATFKIHAFFYGKRFHPLFPSALFPQTWAQSFLQGVTIIFVVPQRSSWTSETNHCCCPERASAAQKLYDTHERALFMLIICNTTVENPYSNRTAVRASLLARNNPERNPGLNPVSG